MSIEPDKRNYDEKEGFTQKDLKRHEDAWFHRNYGNKDKKSAMAKSMSRHQSKVGKAHKGLYPGFAQDTHEHLKRQMENIVKKFHKK